MSGLLRRYRAERLPWTMTSVVPLLLAVCAQAGTRSNPATFVVDVVLASLLFAQFRIFDDLADRRRDAQTHPERVLVRARTVRSIVIAGLILAAATAGILLLRTAVLVDSAVASAARPSAIGAYLALIGLLSSWYSLRGERTLVGDHLLLTKYPAFVWIIATSRVTFPAPGRAAATAQLALSMLAVYLAACVYEALHDDRSPARARPALLLGEGLLLAVTLATLSIRGAV
jgi:4-hydroxybenzoate polyprenyltransferase